MKKWFKIHILWNKYVVVNTNSVNHIHHYSCEWVDNIKDPKYITKKEAKRLLEYTNYRTVICCKAKSKL